MRCSTAVGEVQHVKASHLLAGHTATCHVLLSNHCSVKTSLHKETQASINDISFYITYVLRILPSPNVVRGWRMMIWSAKNVASLHVIHVWLVCCTVHLTRQSCGSTPQINHINYRKCTFLFSFFNFFLEFINCIPIIDIFWTFQYFTCIIAISHFSVTILMTKNTCPSWLNR